MNNGTFLGSGCSREAYLTSDNKVKKIPRYENWRKGAGACDEDTFQLLMDEFKEDPAIQKLFSYLNKGYDIDIAAKGIVTEYLFSLKLKKDSRFVENFALCEELKLRKRNGLDEVGVVGIYENAYTKSQPKEDVANNGLDIPYEISDLHENNLVNDIIVDYACIWVY